MMMFEKVYIEISNSCNLKCNFCPPVERNKKIMSVDAFSEILGKAKDKSKRICLHLMGEPLSHPNFSEIIKICEVNSIFVELTTNGTLITKNEKPLMSKCIGQINISVHSFEANFPFSEVEPYMKKILEFVKDSERNFPSRFINLRVWDLSDSNSLSDKNKKVRDCITNEYGFDFSNIKINLKRKKGYTLRGNTRVHFDSRFIWPSLDQKVIGDKGTCQALKHHIGIHSDGSVVACCLDKEANLKLGNIHKESLNDILMSDRAKKMRKGFDEGVLVESLCQRCDYIKRFK